MIERPKIGSKGRSAARDGETPHSGLDRRGQRGSGVEVGGDREVRRYFDPDFRATAIKVLPGEHYVTGDAEEMLVTVLGSCISACIRDPVAKVGGMNHFMLPGEARGGWGHASNGMRYGHFAMERLINDLLARGAHKDRLEIKLFGGANVLQSNMKIGSNNAEFIHTYLRDERLRVTSEDLGGIYARRVHYFPLTGKVFRLELKREPDRAVFKSELTYRELLRQQQVEGSVELFD